MTVLTVGVTMNDQELQHLVHRSHEEDDPELGDRHGDHAPQEDGGTHRTAERHRGWGGTDETGVRAGSRQGRSWLEKMQQRVAGRSGSGVRMFPRV